MGKIKTVKVTVELPRNATDDEIVESVRTKLPKLKELCLGGLYATPTYDTEGKNDGYKFSTPNNEKCLDLTIFGVEQLQKLLKEVAADMKEHGISSGKE